MENNVTGTATTISSSASTGTTASLGADAGIASATHAHGMLSPGVNTPPETGAPETQEPANEPTPAEMEAARELKKLRDALSKSNAEAAEYKRKLRAQMTEEDRRRAEEAEKQAEIERNYKELLHKTTIAEHSKKLLGLGIDEALAGDMAEALVGAADPNGVFAGMKEYRAALEKQLRAEILKSTPRPSAGEVPKIDFDKQIEAAQASGNSVEVAKLYRLKAEQQQLYKN